MLLAFSVSSALAYTLSGTIYGGSDPLEGATVTLLEAGTLIQLDTTVTGADGFYSFSVDDGTYNLTISGAGYEESVVNGIAEKDPRETPGYHT